MPEFHPSRATVHRAANWSEAANLLVDHLITATDLSRLTVDPLVRARRDADDKPSFTPVILVKDGLREFLIGEDAAMLAATLIKGEILDIDMPDLGEVAIQLEHAVCMARADVARRQGELH